MFHLDKIEERMNEQSKSDKVESMRESMKVTQKHPLTSDMLKGFAISFKGHKKVQNSI